jgi:hypothetical protein
LAGKFWFTSQVTHYKTPWNITSSKINYKRMNVQDDKELKLHSEAEETVRLRWNQYDRIISTDSLQCFMFYFAAAVTEDQLVKR